jgi:photosystem II stability/assembly factor-like uncharacterized protein
MAKGKKTLAIHPGEILKTEFMESRKTIMSSGISFFLAIFFAGSLFAQNYTVQKSNTTENLRGVAVLSNDIAWASGTHGTYLRTTKLQTNHGSWQVAQVPGAENLDFRDVEAFNADLAYLLAAGPGDQSRIYKTTDGGHAWTLQFTNNDPKGFFDCMAFWDSDHGIAVGDPVNGKFVLITTQDGGKNWNPISPDALPPAIEGEGGFAASGTCITVEGKDNVWFVTGGKVARVFRSGDNGKSWTVVDAPITHGADSSGVFSIAFRDATHGVISGGNYKQPTQEGPNLAVTNDGGATWMSTAVAQAYYSAVSFNPRNGHVIAVGSAFAIVMGTERARKISDLNLNALSVNSAGDAVAVGPKGLVVLFGKWTKRKAD